MILHLGVMDIAYSGGEGATTTGTVAEILEARYHVMEIFAIEYEDRIANYLAQAMGDQIQDIVSGAPVPRNPFMDAEQKIFQDFQTFIETEEIAKISPDAPTKAALQGRSKRRKNQQQGPRRVSFRDTGTYMAAFRAWVDAGTRQSLTNFQPFVTGLPGLWTPSF